VAVVAGIVEAQGGALDVRSVHREGTTFEVYIPLISDEEVKAKRLPEVSPEGHERVAVIDDDPGVLFVVKTFLERLGYQAAHFRSARDFLDALETRGQEFDVVVTDLAMADMSGIQLARYLTEHRPDLRVVLTSGFDEPLEAAQVPASPAHAILRKPYGAVDIGRVIRRVVDTNR